MVHPLKNIMLIFLSFLKFPSPWVSRKSQSLLKLKSLLLAALSQLFWWFLNDESIGLLASFVTWFSQLNATDRSRVGNPKGIDTKPNLYLLFIRMLDFFFFFYKKFIYHFIGIHFHNSKNCVKKNYTGFIVRKGDKNNCKHFFFPCVWISLLCE